MASGAEAKTTKNFLARAESEFASAGRVIVHGIEFLFEHETAAVQLGEQVEALLSALCPGIAPVVLAGKVPAVIANVVAIAEEVNAMATTPQAAAVTEAPPVSQSVSEAAAAS